jgi:hypothetical protein
VRIVLVPSIASLLIKNKQQFNSVGVTYRPNASVTPGAVDHGAGSCAPNRYQAVPSQRAIGMGNILGNSKSPTALRL